MSATESDLPIALIGCGRLAEAGYLPAVARVPGVRVIAVADPDPGRREIVGRLAEGAAGFSDAEALAGAGLGLRGAIVAAPVDQHLPAAEALARAGVPALVEKPPARDGRGARALAALEPSPWIGFNRRYLQGRELVGAVPAGEIEIAIELSYRRRSWRPLGDLGDAWLDLGPHAVDLGLLLSGEHEGRVRSAELSPTTASVRLELGRADVAIELNVDSPHRERVAVAPAGGEPVAVSATPGPVRGLLARLRGEHPLVASLAAQVGDFATALRGGEPERLASAAEGAAAMRLIDAAREAAE